MTSSLTPGEFAALVSRTGLPLDAAQLATLHAVHGHLEAMVARNRSALGGGTRSRAAEPAHVFVPGQS